MRAALMVALAGAWVNTPADAQSVFGRKRAPVEKAAASKTEVVRSGPVTLAVVSLRSQTVTLFDGTTKVAQAPISSGTSSNPTPMGVFSVIGKERYHESNLYSNAPMPFMQRLTWSGIALHAGNLPGYPASHGCVRLPSDFAERLFGMTKVGMRVIVAPEGTAPSEVVHPRLPVPVFTRVDDVASPVVSNVAPVGGMGLIASAAAAPAPSVAGAMSTLLNPMQAAEVEKKRAARLAIETAAAAKIALQDAVRAVDQVEAARQDVNEAMADVGQLRKLLGDAQKLVASATADEDRAQAWASLAVVEEDLAEALRVVDRLRIAETRAGDASFEAARRAREAEDAAERAEAAAKSAKKASEPITIFVSRKANKVFVRQGFDPIAEGDVTIADANRSIGTHVINALEVQGDGAQLRWSGITVPDASFPPGSLMDALGRVEFAPDIAADIGKRLWVGATLIISDHGISHETGKGTDFVVLTK